MEWVGTFALAALSWWSGWASHKVVVHFHKKETDAS